MSKYLRVLIITMAVIQFDSFAFAKKDSADAKEGEGPTIFLCCNDTNKETNPLSDFMYFVPLISPVDVTNEKNENNNQTGYVLSCKRDTKKNLFTTSCEFRMEGKGYNLNDFDKGRMIERNEKNVKKGKPIKNILDYIKFHGEGYGRIDIRGKIENGENIVTEVKVHFNARGSKSPVYAGLYSVKPKDGQYSYDNKFDTKVARVNTLVFTKIGAPPKMDIKVASVGESEESLGFIEGIIGGLANLVIQPFEITEIGNEQMLELGLALYEDEKKFTFPKAENLIVNGTKEK